MSTYPIELLKDELNKRGFRLTLQRQKILGIFQAVPKGNHISAEELHSILKRDNSRISLSTVYRTLRVMTHMGILRELELAEGHKHYELNLPKPGQHHHLVCIQCNRTLEFEDESATRIGFKEAEVHGYHVLDCQLTIYAVCPDAIEAGAKQTLQENWVCARQLKEKQSPNNLTDKV